MRCSVTHISLLLPPVGAVAQQNCTSPHLDEPHVTIAEISTTISITGTADSSLSVKCYRDNGITTAVQNSTFNPGTGTILITYTVLEGSVDIFCKSTCDNDEQGETNIITITGEGERVVFSVWLMLWCTYCLLNMIEHMQLNQVEITYFSLHETVHILSGQTFNYTEGQ